MVKKPPKGRNFFFLFFIISFTFSLSPYGKKQNHLLFSPFLSPEIGKRDGKTSFKKIFFLFFFLTFFHPTAPRNLKNYHLLFFFEIPTKCPNISLRALKFHFLQITFFPRWLRGHIHLPTHTPFFRHIMPKKRA